MTMNENVYVNHTQRYKLQSVCLWEEWIMPTSWNFIIVDDGGGGGGVDGGSQLKHCYHSWTIRIVSFILYIWPNCVILEFGQDDVSESSLHTNYKYMRIGFINPILSMHESSNTSDRSKINRNYLN